MVTEKMRELKRIAQTLIIAIAHERSSYQMYKSAGSSSQSPRAKEVFAVLSEQESEHEVRLRELLRQVNEEIESEKRRKGK